MSRKSSRRRRWWLPNWNPQRLNRRALIILAGSAAAVILLYFPLKAYQESWLRRTALDQARQASESGHMDQAFAHITAYLNTWPDDLAGMELRGELASKSVTSPDQVIQAIKALDTLLRLDPDAPNRQDDRKRLVELSVRLGDMIHAGAERSKVGTDKFENRYRYANKIADQRIKLGADDGESHRLLATTLERLAESGDNEAGVEAIKEYQKALRRDPGDFASAERLASLRIERRKDQAGADQILDNLVKARPRSVDARLVRARYFLKTGREDRAKADVDAASRLESGNKGVRMMAASLSMRRGDAAAARRHLAAIPEADRDDNRLDMLDAQLEYLERRPEKAIERLRSGLMRTSGTDRELTWRLAYWLTSFGRAAEARPLMAQYCRLVGRPDHPMVRLLEGMIRERAGRHASAIVELDLAREEIDGEWKSELEVVLGRCQEALGDLEAAEASFLRARDLSPSSPAPRQALAKLLLRTNPDRAVAELEEAIRISPNSPALLAELASVHLARQADRPQGQRDWAAAEAAVERGLRVRPDDLDLLKAKSRVMMASGRAEQAAAALDEAIKVGRSLEDAWLAKAQFLENRGRAEEALVVLDRGSSPNAAGDKPRLRLARANLLARTGHGRAALNLLSVDVEKFAPFERASLVGTRAGLLLSLGDRAGARLACSEWASLAPGDPAPGLKLIDMARRGGSAEEMDHGVELLTKAVGDDEPIALAAQAIAILVPLGDDQSVSARLDQAELLGQKLQDVAPQLPVTSLVRALLAEQSSEFEEAIAAYKQAIKRDNTGIALPRLVALLTRLKRVDDLAALKEHAPAASVDRLTVREALHSGDKEQAEALLARLVEAQPDNLEYRADLARTLRDLGRPEQAEKTLRALVDRRPDRPQAWLALLALQLDRKDAAAAAATVARLKSEYKGERGEILQARCSWMIGDRDGAKTACEAELARKPDDLEALRLASEIEEVVGRNDRAEALLVRARKVDPNLGWARRRLAAILASRVNHSRWAEARAMIEPASGSPDSPEDRLFRALVLERGPAQGHRSEAIGGFRSLASDLPASNPIGRRARVCLARLLLATNEPGEAARAILPLTGEEASPDHATLALAVEALALEGKAEEARPLLDRASKLEPGSPATVVCRALVLKAEGDAAAAASALIEAAAAADKLPDAERVNRYYFDRLARIGADDDVEAFARRMAQRWPAQGSALAGLLASKGRVDEALEAGRVAAEAGSAREVLKVVLTLDATTRLDPARSEKARAIAISAAVRHPKDAAVLTLTTSLLRHQLRFEDEASVYRKVLAAEPANVVARNNLAWVLGHDLNLNAEALVEIDRVIQQIGPQPQAIDTRGMILAKLGRLDEAIAELERASKVDPSAIHQIHLARAYAQAGRLDDRRRTLEAARAAAVNLAALEPEDRAELNSAIH